MNGESGSPLFPFLVIEAKSESVGKQSVTAIARLLSQYGRCSKFRKSFMPSLHCNWIMEVRCSGILLTEEMNGGFLGAILQRKTVNLPR